MSGQILTPHNGGFRPGDIERKRFQEVIALAIDKHAHAITQTREFMADLSVRIDDLSARVAMLQAALDALSTK